nr:MAG TPA: hypothetical protein [Caudoviricetes sp.]
MLRAKRNFRQLVLRYKIGSNKNLSNNVKI